MAADPGGVEQAVSRALRDNLNNLQRMAEDLQQAVADTVAACASSRPTNALPPMLRAQAVSASLAAALEVLSRFVTAALQPAERTPAEAEVLRIVGLPQPEPAPSQPPPLPRVPTPMGEVAAPVQDVSAAVPLEAAAQAEIVEQSAPVAEAQPVPEVSEPEGPPPAAEIVAPPEEIAEPLAAFPKTLFVPPPAEPVEQPQESPAPAPVLEEARAFDLASLPREERELHQRASRIAKVSMQDIKMLRPEQVRLGREHKDICARLKVDIEKARKEYDRRFHTILDHPVDYFYSWMVEILAGGDPEALGEYPYPSAVLRR